MIQNFNIVLVFNDEQKFTHFFKSLGCAVDFDISLICWPSTSRNTTSKSICNSIMFEQGNIIIAALPSRFSRSIEYTYFKHLYFRYRVNIVCL